MNFICSSQNLVEKWKSRGALKVVDMCATGFYVNLWLVEVIDRRLFDNIGSDNSNILSVSQKNCA